MENLGPRGGIRMWNPLCRLIMRRRQRCRHAFRLAAPAVASLFLCATLGVSGASAQTVDEQIREMRVEMHLLREELDLVKAELRRLTVSRPLLVASTDPGRLSFDPKQTVAQAAPDDQDELTPQAGVSRGVLAAARFSDAGSFGFRVGRRLTPRFTAELNVG